MVSSIQNFTANTYYNITFSYTSNKIIKDFDFIPTSMNFCIPAGIQSKSISGKYCAITIRVLATITTAYGSAGGHFVCTVPR